MPPYCFCPVVSNDHGYSGYGYTSARELVELNSCWDNAEKSILIPSDEMVFIRVGNTGTRQIRWSLEKTGGVGGRFGPIKGEVNPGENMISFNARVPGGGTVSLSLYTVRKGEEDLSGEVCRGFGWISDEPLVTEYRVDPR